METRTDGNTEPQRGNQPVQGHRKSSVRVRIQTQVLCVQIQCIRKDCRKTWKWCIIKFNTAKYLNRL
ncbi:hypothetical protein Y1Q_0016428 [Alligator mississippiensis]|uniref:Uncharacterized protein n=1 Tax=Alligator mississippiensis TaxID=8496 RepID=A0A151N2S0_ALLMI|nr:hypothetical protein Y1Q_0016428 [Alligator mississippiensis]